MRLQFLFIFFFINVVLFGQQQDSSIENSEEPKADIFKKLRLRAKFEDVKNSVYLSEEWNHYNIILQTDEQIDGLVAKYDVQNNNFEIRVNGKTGILAGDRVKQFTKANDQQKSGYFNIKSFANWTEGDYKRGFVQSIYKGKKKQVYKYHYVKIIESTGNLALATQGNIKLSKSHENIVFGESGFSKLETSKKKNLKFFEEDGSEVMGYIKENKLSFKNEQDIKKIFSYYDELETQP